MTITKTILGTMLLGSIISYQHGEKAHFDGTRKVATEQIIKINNNSNSKIIDPKNQIEEDLLQESSSQNGLHQVNNLQEDLQVDIQVEKIETKEIIASYEKKICKNNQKINALESTISKTNTQLNEVLSLLKSKEKDEKIKKDKEKVRKEDQKIASENELKDKLLELYLSSQSNFFPRSSFSSFENIRSNPMQNFMSEYFQTDFRQPTYTANDFFRLSFLNNSNFGSNFNNTSSFPSFGNKKMTGGNTFISSPDTSLYRSFASNMPVRGQSFLDAGFYGDDSLRNYGLIPQIKIPDFGRNTTPLKAGFDFNRNI